MDIIKKYFPQLSARQYEQFMQMGDIYGYWNERINLISRKDIKNLYLHHILHSLSIGLYHPFKKNMLVMDVGTGGGFPGIPLAVLFPETEFYLIDSIAKKIKVVNEVVVSLGIKNVRAEQVRAADVKVKCNYVVSRAVSSLPVFYDWVKDKFAILPGRQSHGQEQGILYLKGGDINEELISVPGRAREVLLSEYFEEDFFETKKIVFIPV